MPLTVSLPSFNIVQVWSVVNFLKSADSIIGTAAPRLLHRCSEGKRGALNLRREGVRWFPVSNAWKSRDPE
jgi:hypothetical protein